MVTSLFKISKYPQYWDCDSIPGDAPTVPCNGGGGRCLARGPREPPPQQKRVYFILKSKGKVSHVATYFGAGALLVEPYDVFVIHMIVW